MTREQKINGAVLILQNVYPKLTDATAAAMATQLYDFFLRPGGPVRHIPAGEIARRFRDRYEALEIELAAALNLDAPL